MQTLILLSLLLSISIPTSANASAIIIVQTGKLTARAQKPVTGIQQVTFKLFANARGDASEMALWEETYALLVDATGEYKVELGAQSDDSGATKKKPLDAALFSSGEKRYFEVSVEGETLKPRLAVAQEKVAEKPPVAKTAPVAEKTTVAEKTAVPEPKIPLEPMTKPKLAEPKAERPAQKEKIVAAPEIPEAKPIAEIVTPVDVPPLPSPAPVAPPAPIEVAVKEIELPPPPPANSGVAFFHTNEMGNSFVLESVNYTLDDSVIYAHKGAVERDEPLQIFQGKVPSGPHQLTVSLVYHGVDFLIFNYLDSYQFRIQSSYSFNTEDGKTTTVKVVGFDNGDITTELKDRPAVRYGVDTSAGAP